MAAASTPARSTASLITSAARSSGRSPASAPPYRPTGVRIADRTTARDMSPAYFTRTGSGREPDEEPRDGVEEPELPVRGRDAVGVERPRRGDGRRDSAGGVDPQDGRDQWLAARVAVGRIRDGPEAGSVG